ncbi:MAG: hypothetical protein LBQ37_02690 [Elusimicrobiota bacterium]|jgi:hypothetical protein|nr:hypothetical protein [Elusimicrobiota bacterium]
MKRFLVVFLSLVMLVCFVSVGYTASYTIKFYDNGIVVNSFADKIFSDGKGSKHSYTVEADDYSEAVIKSNKLFNQYIEEMLRQNPDFQQQFYSEEVSEDHLEKTKSITLFYNTLISLNKDLKETANFVISVDVGKDTPNDFVFGYTAKDWLFIDSIILFIDGNKILLQTTKNPVRNVGNGIIQEIVSVFPTTQQLKSMLNAKEILVRLSGANGKPSKDFMFSSQNIYNFKKFYETYLKPKK